MSVVLIDAGCAECHGPGAGPLIEALTFDRTEDAKAWVAAQSWGPWVTKHHAWEPHPQGGEHMIHGQGSLWILPEGGLS